jgi:threonine/homoserine/homoserine lactone efflux protein
MGSCEGGENAIGRLLGFILAGFALTGSPGPATLSIAATGAAFGAKRGLGYMAGTIVGVAAVMALVASGLIGLMLAVPGAAPVMAALAAAYMVYLAWRIASAPPLGEQARARPPSIITGFGLALVNPKAYAAMAALFSGFVLLRDQPELDALVKGLMLVAMIIPVNLAWLLAGSALTRCFREPTLNRAINIAFAVLLLASVALALLL